MAAAPVAQRYRTTSARAAAPAATANVRPSAVPASRALSRAEVADIMGRCWPPAHTIERRDPQIKSPLG